MRGHHRYLHSLDRELGRDVERPRLRRPLDERPPPLHVLERDALDIASGGWSIGEPLFRDLVGDEITQARDDAPTSQPQARRVVFAPTHRVPQSDRRNYAPDRQNAPVLSLDGVPADFSTAPAYLSNAQQVFKNPAMAIPCVIRKVRREVMFAKRKAGYGYKVRKRRTWISDIPC